MRSLKRILIVLVSIPVFLFVFVTVALLIVHKTKGIEFSYENNGSDLSFSSSDGGWSATEDMINSRNFEKLLVSFELYRIHCNKAEVDLLRTKDKKKPYKWAWWFDDYDSPKWKVPFVEMANIPSSIEPPCDNKNASEDERRLANINAAQLIAHLNSVDRL